MIRKLLMVFFAFVVSSAWAFKFYNFEAGNIYVSKTGNDSNDGKSWNTAKRTIQAGVDAAAEGYTVWVAPGDYADAVNRTYNGKYTIPTVVYVNKRILVKSSEGRDKTFITGAWSTDSASVNGVGKGAKRCVFLGVEGCGIEGFTIRKGATTHPSTSDAPKIGDDNFVLFAGGVVAATGSQTTGPDGVCVGYTIKPAYVINCIIEDCRSYAGAAIMRAMPINCLFRRNLCIESGHVSYRLYSAYNCIFADNGPQIGTARDYVHRNSASVGLLNCTYINNNCDTLTGPSKTEVAKVYNCAFLGNAQESSASAATMFTTNCVTDKTSGQRAAGPGCKGGVIICQTVSSLDGDYRPVAGRDLVGAGSRDVLEWGKIWVPEEFIYADHYGNPRPFGLLDPDIDVGAVQSTVAGGVVMESGGVGLGQGVTLTTDNDDTYTGAYAGYGWKGWVKCPSKSVRFSYTPAKDTAIFAYNTYGVKYKSGVVLNKYQYPELKSDNGIYFDAPTYGALSWLRVTAITTTSIKYADANFSDYSKADGSAQYPYETIQEAVDASESYGVVVVKPGTYNKGKTIAPIDIANDGQDTNSTPNRVYINKHLRVYSTGGASKTIIEGAKDTSASGAYLGCGPNAVRCVLAIYYVNCAVQGFTLRNGATDGDLGNRGRYDKNPKTGEPRWNSSDNVARGNFGGGGFRGDIRISGNYPSLAHITDCIVTGCTAYFGGAIYGGIAQRCLFYGNSAVHHDTSKGGDPGATSAAPCGIIFGSTLRSCIVRDNSIAVSSSIIVYTRAHFTTAYKQAIGDFCPKYYSFLNDISIPTVAVGCADPANGDFRLKSGSPAMHMPALPNETDYWNSIGSDYYGNPVLHDPDNYNYVMMGAVQDVAFCIDTVPASGSGSTATKTVLSPGEKTTVEAVGSNRPFQGFQVGDEFIGQEEQSYTFTAPAFDYRTYLAAYNYPVKPVYDTHLYVDAVDGDDSNDGWYKATPVRTLSCAMGKRGVTKGDTVHCAPGVYNEGSMKRTNPFNGGNASDISISARVVIPAGVTLVADGSAEETIIEGYKQPGGPSYTFKPEWGMGPEAMRCVEMYAGSTLKGFTLRNGATDWTTAATSAYVAENCYSAGVMCQSGGATVINCVIDYCHSRFYGGSINGIFIGCKFTQCVGTSNGGAGGFGKYYSCYFDKCFDRVVVSPYAFENCTIDRNCLLYDQSGNYMSQLIEPRDGVPIVNSVILSQVSGKTTTSYISKNCVWLNQKCYTFLEGSVNNSSISYSQSAKLLNEDGTPAFYEGSLLIDRGDSALVSSVNTVDIVGTQRIYNRNVDIGAGEYNWLPTFTELLVARKGATIDYASPGTAISEDTKLLVTDGNVAIVWPSGRTGLSSVVDFEVIGLGKMVVKVNGAVKGEYVAEEGVRRLKLDLSNSARIEIAYERAEDDDDTAGALLSASTDKGGMSVILRPRSALN